MSEATRFGAVFDSNRVFRYSLWRQWEGHAGSTFVVIGLNPSTADEEKDDPTIRRCISFAKREGCSRLVMLNLFALRSTDPKALYDHSLTYHDVVGPGNHAVIRTYLEAQETAIVVAAWGAHGRIRAQDVTVRCMADKIGRPLHCFGVTKNGQPRHPLYLRGDCALVPFPLNGGER